MQESDDLDGHKSEIIEVIESAASDDTHEDVFGRRFGRERHSYRIPRIGCRL